MLVSAVPAFGLPSARTLVAVLKVFLGSIDGREMRFRLASAWTFPHVVCG
jgi:hypothetical protein